MTRPLVLGFGYAATRTAADDEMRRFFAALGVAPSAVAGASATMYRFPDGSFFGVAAPDVGEDGEGEAAGATGSDDGRIVGFRVASLDEAMAALAAAGFPTIDEHENELSRYAHVDGPDGRLYELVEMLGARAG